LVFNTWQEKLIIILETNQFKIILMKSKIYILVALLATTFAGIYPAMSQTGTVNDTLYMGAGYANEIYYSMSAGQQGTAVRSSWDIAFRANWMSASIITNDASGVVLYTYPNSDTAGWKNVDTIGIKNWTKMYNSPTDWETGAFCVNQKGNPDYGWGIYNQFAPTHPVVGDSLFIIKLRDGSFRKLWIIQKISTNNVFEFRFANIGGNGETTMVSLDCAPYSSKNFIGYSISDNKIVDFEPVASKKWDILFTKYMGLSGTTPYPYTGALSNYGVKANKFKPVSLDYTEYTSAPMNDSRSFIGAGWKAFNFGTNTYDMVDSLVYFVQDKGGNINKLIFKGFDIPTGRIILAKGIISFTGINDAKTSGFNAAVYPNPVSDVMNLVINPGKASSALVNLFDVAGHAVLSKRYTIQAEELTTLQIPVSELRSGIYMVKIQAGEDVISRKVIVNN
jgi:hypothetical protein